MAAEENKPAIETESTQPEPLTVGQLGMWIFISTEVMLFSAIIATYLVLRLSTLGVGWPRPEIMHASIVYGIINTIILVLSGVTASNIVASSRENRPRAARLWLIATMILGLSFLGIKSFEYYQKYEVGLLPVAGQKQIHEKADYQYVSHVNRRLGEAIAELESLDLPENPLSETETERLELLYSLKQDMAVATARNAGRTTSPYHAQLCMNLMAWQIFPHPDSGHNVEQVLEPELHRLNLGLEENHERLFLIKRRQKMVAAQVLKLDSDLQQFQLLGASGDDAAESDAKKTWLETKKKQTQNLAIESTRIQSVINPMQGRLDNLMGSFGQEDDFLSINERYDFRLPVVIPSGQAWISVYLLLSGMHALHLFAGLIALLFWLPRKLTAERSPALYITCMYWQFVDAIWLAIFWFIYF